MHILKTIPTVPTHCFFLVFKRMFRVIRGVVKYTHVFVHSRYWNLLLQECIPVGCVPPTSVVTTRCSTGGDYTPHWTYTPLDISIPLIYPAIWTYAPLHIPSPRHTHSHRKGTGTRNTHSPLNRPMPVKNYLPPTSLAGSKKNWWAWSPYRYKLGTLFSNAMLRYTRQKLYPMNFS